MKQLHAEIKRAAGVYVLISGGIGYMVRISKVEARRLVDDLGGDFDIETSISDDGDLCVRIYERGQRGLDCD